MPKLMKHNESSVKRKIHSTECLHEEIGEIPYQQVNNMKVLEQKGENTPKMGRWQELVKLWTEINQLETKGTIKDSAGTLKTKQDR